MQNAASEPRLNAHDITVSPEDAHLLREFRWTRNFHGYAVRYYSDQSDGRTRAELLHRRILGLPITTKPGPGAPKKSAIVDHINGDKLDNRRENLRIVDQQINMQNRRQPKNRNNSSGYRNVSFYGQTRRWKAFAKLNYKRIHLGYYDTAEEASAVAEAFRKQHYAGVKDPG